MTYVAYNEIVKGNSVTGKNFTRFHNEKDVVNAINSGKFNAAFRDNKKDMKIIREYYDISTKTWTTNF